MVFFQYFTDAVWQPRDLQMPQHVVSAESLPSLHYRIL